MKIRLEKYNTNDFEAYFELVQDDETMKYISGKGLNREEAAQKFSSILEKGNVDENLGYFKVFDQNNLLLGDCKLVENNHLENSLEIGYLIRKEFWRRGFGSKICAHLLSEAKTKFPQLDVMAVIDPANLASRKILINHGFESYFIGEENDLPTEKLRLNL